MSSSCLLLMISSCLTSPSHPFRFLFFCYCCCYFCLCSFLTVPFISLPLVHSSTIFSLFSSSLLCVFLALTVVSFPICQTFISLVCSPHFCPLASSSFCLTCPLYFIYASFLLELLLSVPLYFAILIVLSSFLTLACFVSPFLYYYNLYC